MPDTLHEVIERLITVEARLKEHQRKIELDQRVVELETVERIEARAWQTFRNRILPIPILMTILWIVVAVITGRSFGSLKEAAAEARISLNKTIANFRSEAKMIGVQIDSMKPTLKQLQQDVEQLGASLHQAQSQVETLQQKYEVVRGEKTAEAYKKIYPIFGERVVGNAETYISCRQKKANDIYLEIMLSEPQGNRRFLDLQKVTKATDMLTDKGFTIYHGPVSLVAASPTSSQSQYEFGETSCPELAKTSGPPCVYYFRKNFPVGTLKPILGGVQPMTDNRFTYVSPQDLAELPRLLIEKSCLDAIVVLGK